MKRFKGAINSPKVYCPGHLVCMNSMYVCSVVWGDFVFVLYESRLTGPEVFLMTLVCLLNDFGVATFV